MGKLASSIRVLVQQISKKKKLTIGEMILSVAIRF
jgi:hypothetical protein